MNVHIVLDASALVAYLAMDMRSVQVGELIKMVEEDHGIVGIPALCFLDAHEAAADDERRARLAELPTASDGVTAILPLLGGDTLDVATLGRRMPTSQAHAAVETRKRGATLATYDAKPALRYLDEDDVVDLSAA